MANEHIKLIALEIWGKMNDNQKYGVQFGMFPQEIMKHYANEDNHALVVALMKLAK